jgi:uncharacterized protein YneF (UPF0154 family)
MPLNEVLRIGGVVSRAADGRTVRRAMTKRGRKARQPMDVATLPSFEEAEERSILAVMRPWPRQMEAQLKAHGYESFAGGDRVLQELFERTLNDPREVDALTVITELAELGHRAAREAIRKYAKAMLVDSGCNPSAPIRSYLIKFIDGQVADHPPDVRNDIVRNMLRDIGIATMASDAVARWRLPELYSSGRRHSAAWFVAVVMTEHGYKLSERQVRRLIQTYGHGFGARLADFLLAGVVEQTI